MPSSCSKSGRPGQAWRRRAAVFVCLCFFRERKSQSRPRIRPQARKKFSLFRPRITPKTPVPYLVVLVAGHGQLGELVGVGVRHVRGRGRRRRWHGSIGRRRTQRVVHRARGALVVAAGQFGHAPDAVHALGALWKQCGPGRVCVDAGMEGGRSVRGAFLRELSSGLSVFFLLSARHFACTPGGSRAGSGGREQRQRSKTGPYLWQGGRDAARR